MSVSWTRAVSNSSTEAENISSVADVRLLMEGTPVLSLWDAVIDVLQPVVQVDLIRTHRQTHSETPKNKFIGDLRYAPA